MYHHFCALFRLTRSILSVKVFAMNKNIHVKTEYETQKTFYIHYTIGGNHDYKERI